MDLIENPLENMEPLKRIEGDKFVLFLYLLTYSIIFIFFLLLITLFIFEFSL